MAVPRTAALVSSSVGILLAVGLSYRLIGQSRIETLEEEHLSHEAFGSIDPALEAEFEAKYAGIPSVELAQQLQPLDELIRTLARAAVDQLIADGEFEEYLADSPPPSRSQVTRVSAGSIAWSGPPEARVVRNVVVPEGYDAELDLLRIEYFWLARKCGVNPEHVAPTEEQSH